MDQREIIYLERVIERASERRRTLFGSRKTTRAEAAEAVLVAYAPSLIREIKRLRANWQEGDRK